MWNRFRANKGHILHALTGCDSTMSTTGYGKKTSWSVFEETPDLFNGVGGYGIIEHVEELICKLYCAPDALGDVNQAPYHKTEHKEHYI